MSSATSDLLHPWPDCKLVLPAYATREEWLQGRSLGLGGSDMVILMGHGYASGRTERQLWLEKSGQKKPEESGGTIRMRRGNHMEVFIREEFQAASREVYQCELVPVSVGLVQSLEHPEMLASADARILGDGAVEPYEGAEWKHLDNYPVAKLVREIDHLRQYPRFYWQVVHYLAVTGAPGWWLAADSPYYDKLVLHYVAREDVLDDIERCIEKATEWWQRHIVLGFEVPTVSGQLAEELAPILEDKVEAMMPWQVQADLERLAELRYPGTKAGKAERAEIEQRLWDAIGNHKVLTLGDEPVLTVQTRAGRGSLDWDRMEELLPGAKAAKAKATVRGNPTRSLRFLRGDDDE